jgi:hypothetical protein
VTIARKTLAQMTSDDLDQLHDQLARAGSVLARLVNAPDAAEHCHTVPPNWDGGGPCEYCTALEEARAIVAADETAPARTQATEAEKTTRVIALYERWVKAGPPPLGTSMSRWWDARLVELHHAILPPVTDQPKEQ